MLIGEKIKIIRAEKNMGQEEMADALYVSPQAISNWERGKSYPDFKNIIRISELYDISLDELVLEDIDYKKTLQEKKLDKKVDVSFDIVFTIILLFFIGYSLWKHNYNGYLLVSMGYVIYNVVKLYKVFYTSGK